MVSSVHTRNGQSIDRDGDVVVRIISSLRPSSVQLKEACTNLKKMLFQEIPNIIIHGKLMVNH